MKKIIALFAAFFVVFGMSMSIANATGGTKTCTPKAAYTETVHHPAETHVEHTKAVDGQSAVWANFAPNDKKATFVGPPTYPTDSRGTWIVHKSLPPGQAGPDGVYSRGNPAKGGNWFYRHAAVRGTPASDVTIIDKPAMIETIHHAAVTCKSDEPKVKPRSTFEPAPVPTVRPKHVVTPTVVHAGL